MVIETLYRTSDNEIFNDYDLAYRHEMELEKDIEGFFALTSDGKIIRNFSKSMEKVYYVELPTDSIFEQFKKASERDNIVYPDSKGIWLFDMCGWIDLESEFEDIKKRWCGNADVAKRLKLKLDYELTELNK